MGLVGAMWHSLLIYSNTYGPPFLETPYLVVLLSWKNCDNNLLSNEEITKNQ